MELENGIQQNWTTVDNLIIDDEEHFDGVEKWVFVLLLRYAFKVGSTAFPSQRTLAKRVGISDRQIRRYLGTLEEKKFLIKVGKKEDTQTIIWKVQIPAEVQKKWLQKQLDRLEEKEEIIPIVLDKPVKKKKDPKIQYDEFISMTQAEYNKLVDQHGEDKTKQMIQVLNNYKGANGKKYKSDYMAILNWVVDRVNGQTYKKGGKHGKIDDAKEFARKNGIPF